MAIGDSRLYEIITIDHMDIHSLSSCVVEDDSCLLLNLLLYNMHTGEEVTCDGAYAAIIHIIFNQKDSFLNY
jgi:hypothetical protein